MDKPKGASKNKGNAPDIDAEFSELRKAEGMNSVNESTAVAQLRIRKAYEFLETMRRNHRITDATTIDGMLRILGDEQAYQREYSRILKEQISGQSSSGEMESFASTEIIYSRDRIDSLKEAEIALEVLKMGGGGAVRLSDSTRYERVREIFEQVIKVQDDYFDDDEVMKRGFIVSGDEEVR